MSEIKGKLEALKLNGEKNGKPVHYLKVNGQTLTVDISNEYGARVGSFVAKAKVGDEVTVTLSKFGSVSKFSTGGGFSSIGRGGFSSFGGGGFAKKAFVKKEYDATGPIQGMVLAAAVSKAESHTVTDIVKAAKIILEAKTIVDKLVVDALGTKKEETVKSNDNPFEGLDEDIGKEESFEDSDPF